MRDKIGLWISVITCGIMIALDIFNIAIAPIEAYIVCGIAAVFFMTHGDF